ncbi:MAG TPA: DUF2794 domain-containing protein [Rhizobiaceae bacterium]|nr:DUF2794 domain-containing protein [Rhizobiaceae bacterium]
MTDAVEQPEASGERVLIPFSEARQARDIEQVTFNRRELDQLLRLYSMMVGAGEWRDYAMDFLKDRAVFSVYRRSSEVPLYRIEKNPRLARRQGEYAVIAASGMILKRGADLARVLGVFDKALRLVHSR